MMATVARRVEHAERLPNLREYGFTAPLGFVAVPVGNVQIDQVDGGWRGDQRTLASERALRHADLPLTLGHTFLDYRFGDGPSHGDGRGDAEGGERAAGQVRRPTVTRH